MMPEISNSVRPIEIAGQFLCQELAHRISTWSDDHIHEVGLAACLHSATTNFLWEKQSDRSGPFPTSTSNFLDIVEPVFSSSFIAWRWQAFEKFDMMAGGPDSQLSNAFIQERTVLHWLGTMTNAIASFSLCRLEEMTPRFGQFDGPGDSLASYEAPLPLTDPAEPTVNIIQLHLRGESVRDAWENHATTRRMERECIPPSGSTWTPDQAGGLYVYHATNAHFEKAGFAEKLSKRPFEMLRRFTSVSQMAPLSHPATYTAFSPLRSYLWGLFLADPIQSLPEPSLLDRRNRKWMSGGHEYAGVVLFQFASRQPCPPGLTSFCIPRGQELAWHEQTMEMNGDDRDAWNNYQRFTQASFGASSNWPDLIHGLQLPIIRRQLPKIGNPFDTVWTSEAGIQALNASHSETYAITLELVPAETLEPKSGRGGPGSGPGPGKKDDGRNDGKQSRRGDTIRKKLKKVRSRMSLTRFRQNLE